MVEDREAVLINTSGLSVRNSSPKLVTAFSRRGGAVAFQVKTRTLEVTEEAIVMSHGSQLEVLHRSS